MKLNKKKVFTIALAICLIAILSMGSLAWFSDTVYSCLSNQITSFSLRNQVNWRFAKCLVSLFIMRFMAAMRWSPS